MSLSMQSLYLGKLVPFVLCFYFFRDHCSLIRLSFATGALHPILSFGTPGLGPAPNALL